MLEESIPNSVKTKEFDGVYSIGQVTDDNQLADESLLALSCTPGKAYVRGYEIEKTGVSFKDIKKARDFDTINAGVSNLEIGNFVRVTNAYNIPDIGDVSGETTPYKTLQLFDEFTGTGNRGSASNLVWQLVLQDFVHLNIIKVR